MAKVNGTSLLIYSDGELIAAQRSGTMTVDQVLLPTTNKSSGGWEEHINGVRSAGVDFDALYSTTGLSADGLIDLILTRTSVEIIWFPSDTATYSYRGVSDPTNISIDAPAEDVTSISGSFKIKGEFYKNDAGTSGLISGADTSDDDVYRSIDRGSTFSLVGAPTNVFSVCNSNLGDYYFALWDSGDQIRRYLPSVGSFVATKSVDGTIEAGDKVRCSFTGLYVLGFDDTKMYKSSDYGATWSDAATAVVIDCDLASAGVYQVYCTASQIYRSVNSGSTFPSLVYPGVSNILGCSVNDAGDVLIIDDNNDAYFYKQGTGWSAADAIGAVPADVCLNDTYGLVATATDLQKFTISTEVLTEVSSDPFTLVTTDKNGATAYATDGTSVYIYDGTTLTLKGTKDLKDIFTP